MREWFKGQWELIEKDYAQECAAGQLSRMQHMLQILSGLRRTYLLLAAIPLSPTDVINQHHQYHVASQAPLSHLAGVHIRRRGRGCTNQR